MQDNNQCVGCEVCSQVCPKDAIFKEEISMTKSITLVGVGGQGTILASKLLTTGLMNAGYDVKMSEIHGMKPKRRFSIFTS